MTGDRGPTFETLEEELKVVLARHSDLLDNPEGCGRAAAKILKVADKALRPKTLRVEADTHPDGVAIVKFPDAEALAFLGSYRKGTWLDDPDMEVNVADYSYIEIRADRDPDDLRENRNGGLDRD